MMCASLVVVRKKTIIKVHVIRTNKTKEKKEKRSVCDSQNRDKRKGATIIINAERKKVARREQSKEGNDGWMDGMDFAQGRYPTTAKGKERKSW
jgi:hypothetical protein